MARKKKDTNVEPDMKNNDPYNFLKNIDPTDIEWVELSKKAIARQEAIREGMNVPKMTDAERDEQRKLASLAHMAATKAAAAEGALLAAETANLVSNPVSAQVLASTIDIWLVELREEGEAAPKRIYAPTWKQLKKYLKDKNGVWEVQHFELLHNAEDILGFFASEQGYIYPIDSLKEEFDIMVRDGMVFKSDSD
jgi:hypothetical protein